MICKTKAIGSGGYMVENGGKHCTEDARAQNQRDLHVLGESSVLSGHQTGRGLVVPPRKDPLPESIPWTETVCRGRLRTVVHTLGMLLGSLVCVTGGRGPVGKF